MAKELTAQEMKELNSRVDDLFGSLDLKGVTENSTGFEDLPECYILVKVENAELTMSKSGNPQVAFRLKSVADGIDIDVDEKTQATIQNVCKGTKNRVLFKYYKLVDSKDAKKFVSDMLKFQIDENGTQIPEEAFTNSHTISDALELLTDLQIYVNITHSVAEDGSKSSWTNLISWKRASDLGLPID